VLRDKDAARPRSFRVPLYPLTPLLFFGSSLLMAYSALDYSIRNLAWEATCWTALVIASGLVVYALDRKSESRS